MIRPTGDKILISLVREEKTASGIILAQTENIPKVGIVEAVGNGEVNNNGVRVPVDVEVGQKIIFNRYSGTEVEHEGKRYLIINASDVLGVM